MKQGLHLVMKDIELIMLEVRLPMYNNIKMVNPMIG